MPTHGLIKYIRTQLHVWIPLHPEWLTYKGYKTGSLPSCFGQPGALAKDRKEGAVKVCIPLAHLQQSQAPAGQPSCLSVHRFQQPFSPHFCKPRPGVSHCPLWVLFPILSHSLFIKDLPNDPNLNASLCPICQTTERCERYMGQRTVTWLYQFPGQVTLGLNVYAKMMVMQGNESRLELEE